MVKTLNLPLHMHALHIMIQENDDQQIKKNIRLKFPEYSLSKISKFPESYWPFSLFSLFSGYPELDNDL